MIASHRRRHRLGLLILAPVTLALFAAALWGRQPMPQVSILPHFEASSVDGSRHDEDSPRRMIRQLWSREDLFPGWPARISVDDRRVVWLQPLRPLIAPDVLIYWSPGKELSERLPDDAHLLGRLAGTRAVRLVLPEHGMTASPGGDGAPDRPWGSLTLYSLGHQTIVAQAVLTPPPKRVGR